jgi:hypothetical protein
MNRSPIEDGSFSRYIHPMFKWARTVRWVRKAKVLSGDDESFRRFDSISKYSRCVKLPMKSGSREKLFRPISRWISFLSLPKEGGNSETERYRILRA